MKKTKAGFRYYFCNCNCQENSFDDIRRAIDHYDNCQDNTEIVYKSLYDQIYGWLGKICYPY